MSFEWVVIAPTEAFQHLAGVWKIFPPPCECRRDGGAVHSYTSVNTWGLWTITHKRPSVSRVPSPGTSLGGTVRFSSSIIHVEDIPWRWEPPPVTCRTHSGIVLVSVLSHGNIFHGISGARLGRSQMQAGICNRLDCFSSYKAPKAGG